MQRFHSRQVLQKNSGAYYRAIEDMINFSEKQQYLLDIIKSTGLIIKSNMFEIKEKDPELIDEPVMGKNNDS